MSCTSYAFRKRWKWAIQSLGLRISDYQPYGLRRAGACEDFAKYGDGSREEALRVRQVAALPQEITYLIHYWAAVFRDRFATL